MNIDHRIVLMRILGEVAQRNGAYQRKRIFVVRAYMPPNNNPTIMRVEHTLQKSKNCVEVILMGDINLRIRELSNARDEELEIVVAACAWRT